MGFSFGFYNSIEGDRLYDAIQVSKIFDGIILDGVYATVGDAFIVQAGDDPNMVIVGPGRAWFNHTWNENDGYLDLELEPPETVLDRIDAIVIDVDERLQRRENKILVLKGVPSSNPNPPVLIRELEHNQYPLCYILRKSSQQMIGQAQITNTVGTSDCPFVTGVLEGLDVDLMLLQWRAAWAEFLQACQDAIDEWQEVTKQDVALFVSAFKQQCNEYLSTTQTWTETQKTSLTEFYNEFLGKMADYEDEWTTWVDHLKDMLSDDTIGQLLVDIDNIKEDMKDFPTDILGFQQKNTVFSSDGNTITETYSDGRVVVTTFNSSSKITTVLKNSSGETVKTKVTTFNSNGSITTTVS